MAILLLIGIIQLLLIKSTSCIPIPGPDVLFKEIDKNGDTFLDMEELRSWFVEFVKSKTAEFMPVDDMIASSDLDHNGELDAAELKRIFDRNPWRKEIHQAHDTNHDGKLDKQELREMVADEIQQSVQNLTTFYPALPALKKAYQKMLQNAGIDPTWYDMNKDGQMGQFEMHMSNLVIEVLILFDIDVDHKVSMKEYGDSQKQPKLTAIIKGLEAFMQTAANSPKIL